MTELLESHDRADARESALREFLNPNNYSNKAARDNGTIPSCKSRRMGIIPRKGKNI